MADATQFMFDYQEVLQDLIKRQGIHQGRWKLIFELGFAGTSINTVVEEGPVSRPAGMVIIQRIGINQTEEVSNLTADAGKVNPPAKSASGPRKKSAK